MVIWVGDIMTLPFFLWTLYLFLLYLIDGYFLKEFNMMENLNLHDMFFNFIENMSLIIAIMFVAIKLKNYIIQKTGKISIFLWSISFIISWISFSVMYYPFIYQGIRLDLRAAPLFFVSYVAGSKVGLISAILPIIYRFYLEGPTVIEGVTQAILLPVIVGALFHRKKDFTPPLTIINLKRMCMSFFIFQIIKMALMVFTLPVPFILVATMGAFESVALFAMGLMVNDANQSELLKKQLAFQSNHDPMTNLYNIRMFKFKIEELMKQNIPFSIAMFDVDHFKKYNDTHGHQAGDEVLKTIGEILDNTMRKKDIFARYGGEEFILCFTDISDEEVAHSVGERFRKKVEEHVFYGEETQPEGNVTISMGISFSSNGKSLEQIIEEADKSLYQSKHLGRNRITIFKSL
jgi:diguanylate cyclase